MKYLIIGMFSMVPICFSLAIWNSEGAIALGWQWTFQGIVIFVTAMTVWANEKTEIK